MVLSARFTKNPKRSKIIICDHCGLLIVREHIRLYGMTDLDEKPYTLRLHLECTKESVNISQDIKIKAAVAKSEQFQ